MQYMQEGTLLSLSLSHCMFAAQLASLLPWSPIGVCNFFQGRRLLSFLFRPFRGSPLLFVLHVGNGNGVTVLPPSHLYGVECVEHGSRTD